ncbi:transmembrane domain-containing protein [Cryptosporidium canis]|uniref:Transmembrane domain-containing protein n=1 Tax=Cryptosporidium canis TaxID=195482 RepID=A0A9D5DKH3_9CRYT|nr:transmembrane domain-containing protein [Cryptosporidium canis]
MGSSSSDKRRSSGRRVSLESGRVDLSGKASAESNTGVFREMFGTKDNPTVIPFKSIIKNPKIYFPVIAITATLTAGHIQNPDASRELFFKSGGFSFAPEMLESGEAFFTINNVMSVANGAVFVGHIIAGSIIDRFGLLPCALIGHFLSVIGYSLMFLFHFSSFAYYFAGIQVYADVPKGQEHGRDAPHDRYGLLSYAPSPPGQSLRPDSDSHTPCFYIPLRQAPRQNGLQIFQHAEHLGERDRRAPREQRRPGGARERRNQGLQRAFMGQEDPLLALRCLLRIHALLCSFQNPLPALLQKYLPGQH